MKEYYEKRIPERKDPQPYREFAFIESKLVPIKENEKLEIAMQYPLLGFKEAEERCYLREEVAQMLYKACELLPEGFKLRIWDAWRPFALQKELFTVYKKQIIEEFHLENMEEEDRNIFIGKYVANPKKDIQMPPGHTTGGALDLTIVDSQGQVLNMGTDFDEFTDKTKTNYYEVEKVSEDQETQEIRRNRRLLFHLMEEAGFVNLPSEWWHYSYGENSWAFKEKKPSLYKGIFELE